MQFLVVGSIYEENLVNKPFILISLHGVTHVAEFVLYLIIGSQAHKSGLKLIIEDSEDKLINLD